jgi:hypothetical protein
MRKPLAKQPLKNRLGLMPVGLDAIVICSLLICCILFFTGNKAQGAPPADHTVFSMPIESENISVIYTTIDVKKRWFITNRRDVGQWLGYFCVLLGFILWFVTFHVVYQPFRYAENIRTWWALVGLPFSIALLVYGIGLLSSFFCNSSINRGSHFHYELGHNLFY